MTIETKLNVGDKAYFLHKNKVVSERVYKLYIEKEGEHKPSVNYYFKIDYDSVIISEEYCFATKEELIKSL